MSRRQAGTVQLWLTAAERDTLDRLVFDARELADGEKVTPTSVLRAWLAGAAEKMTMALAAANGAVDFCAEVPCDGCEFGAATSPVECVDCNIRMHADSSLLALRAALIDAEERQLEAEYRLEEARRCIDTLAGGDR